MKKFRLLPVLLTGFLIVLLCTACGSKVEGNYRITSCSVEGYSMSPDDIGAGASYIDITGVDDNSTTTIAIGLSDEVSMINGYTTTLTEGTDCTTYKVHVLSVFGGAISSDADMFYLYYYPKNKTIKLVMSEGLEYYFSK